MIPLAPLSFGDVLSGAFSTLGRYWRQVFGLTAAVYGVALLLVGAAAFVAYLNVSDIITRLTNAPDSYDPSWSEISPIVYGAVTVFALAMVVTLAATTLLYAAVPVILQAAVLGHRTTLGEVWGQALSRTPAVLGTLLLSGLITMAPMLGLLLLLLPLALFARDISALILFPVWFLALLLAAPATLWLWVRFSLAPAAAVLEKLGPVGALRRSARLVQGAWWRIFGITFAGLIMAAVVNQVIQLPFSFGGMFAGLAPGFGVDGSGASDTAMFVFVAVYVVFVLLGSLLGSALTAMLPQLVTGLLYVDQRIRKESLDIALAEAAAPTPSE